jgi:purine-nucleoside phosphorylase
MSTVYSLSARQALRKAAEAQGITLREGVYAMLRGPQYETPAEIRMLRLIGADAVGMSTVPEAIVCAAAGVPVLGLSMLSNLAAGLSRTPLRHEEVLAVGARAATAVGAILEAGLAEAVAAVRSEP